MAINFPNSPVTGTQYTENGFTWVFNGKAWVAEVTDRSYGSVWNNNPSEMAETAGGVVSAIGSTHSNTFSNNFYITLTQDVTSFKIYGLESGFDGEDYIGSSGLIEVRQDSAGGHAFLPQNPLNIVMSGDPDDVSRITPGNGVGTIGWYKYGSDESEIYLYISDVT